MKNRYACYLFIALLNAGLGSFLNAQSILEAENAYYSEGIIDTKHTGFTGTGFVDTENKDGVFVEWLINVPVATVDTLAFRFALGKEEDRYMQVWVNRVLIDTINFDNTQEFTNWEYRRSPASLNAGLNRIKLVAINPEGAPNLDHLLINSDTLALPEYTLSIEQEGSGTVSVDPEGPVYTAGTRISVEARGTDGYRFTGWDGDFEGNDNPLVFVIDRNLDLKVTFYKEENLIPAFPGADGFGKYTTGGRGGEVYEVTNLNDSGPGSLRAAIKASGPRTIVFRVSGTIFLESALQIKNGDLTIAGQTAPGDGICLANYPLILDADNVIIRFLRSRLGDLANNESDAFSANDSRNVIIDHCSFSWSIDETATMYLNQDYTMQWCVVSESLYNSHHSKGEHGYGGIWGGSYATFHHNLLAHHTSRNPRFNGARYERNWDEHVDHRNNVVYNWGGNSAYGGEPSELDGNKAKINMVNNYYKAGPATNTRSLEYRIVEPYRQDENNAGYSWWYVAGNVAYNWPILQEENWKLGVQGVASQIKDQIRKDEPFAFEIDTTHSAEEAFEHVLAYSGCILPNRDILDQRIIGETISGTAQYGQSYRGGGNGIIDSQTDVGGWPALRMTSPPADTDHDGMPDAWETARALNPGDPSDRNGDDDNDGYTNLEAYLNELVAAFTYVVRPIRLTGQQDMDTTIVLNWEDISANETGFLLERAVGDGDFEWLGTVDSDVTTYVDTIYQSDIYSYRLRAYNEIDSSYYTEPVVINADVVPTSSILKANELDLQLYPNPFSDQLTISFDLKERMPVQVRVYDRQGRSYSYQDLGNIPAGSYILNWNGITGTGRQLSAGLYFLELRSGNARISRRIVKLP